MTAVPLPELLFENVPFWTGGERGELLIHRCTECGLWIHPAAPACRRCRSTDVGAQPVSGTGTLYSFTVNRQAWLPGLPVPSVIGVVELDEDPELRLTTRVVGLEPHQVRIGLRMGVRFEHVEDVWLPVFAAIEEIA